MQMDLFDNFLLTDATNRLGRNCNYEVPRLSASDSMRLQVQESGAISTLNPSTPSQLKKAVLSLLEPSTPNNVAFAYDQALAWWFPIAGNLSGRLQPAWGENALDMALLCLTVLLYSTIPPESSDSDATELKVLYVQTKSSLAAAEGIGVNTWPLLQARVLVTLFEVSHGLYPAAFISIGGAVRAIEALELYPSSHICGSRGTARTANEGESPLAWCGILVLDR